MRDGLLCNASSVSIWASEGDDGGEEEKGRRRPRNRALARKVERANIDLVVKGRGRGGGVTRSEGRHSGCFPLTAIA